MYTPVSACVLGIRDVQWTVPTNTLPSQSSQIFIISHNKKWKDRVALVLIVQLLYFHCHPHISTFPSDS